jgi:hypothetical protein
MMRDLKMQMRRHEGMSGIARLAHRPDRVSLGHSITDVHVNRLEVGVETAQATPMVQFEIEPAASMAPDGQHPAAPDRPNRAAERRFDVDPDPCDAYCAYRAVCRYQRPPLVEEGALD